MRSHVAEVSHDGRWAIITSSTGTDARHEIHVIDLAARSEKGWAAWRLVEGFEHAWNLVDAIGSRLWFVTNQGAPRYRVVAIDLDAEAPDWTIVVPEVEQPLDGATIVGDKLVLSYLKDAASYAEIRRAGWDVEQDHPPDGPGHRVGLRGPAGRSGNLLCLYQLQSARSGLPAGSRHR